MADIETSSHRQPVDFTDEIFKSVFGEDYQSLTPSERQSKVLSLIAKHEFVPPNSVIAAGILSFQDKESTNDGLALRSTAKNICIRQAQYVLPETTESAQIERDDTSSDIVKVDCRYPQWLTNTDSISTPQWMTLVREQLIHTQLAGQKTQEVNETHQDSDLSPYSLQTVNLVDISYSTKRFREPDHESQPQFVPYTETDSFLFLTVIRIMIGLLGVIILIIAFSYELESLMG